jgi:hypothetical protein
MEDIKETQMTPAEKHYQAMKRAQAKYQRNHPDKVGQWQKEYKERLKQDPEKWAIFVEKNRAKSKAYYANKRKANPASSSSEEEGL